MSVENSKAVSIISVIVPCRNEEANIDRFCDGVVNQSLPEGIRLEILIADGNSDDGTRCRLEKIREREWNSERRIEVVENPDLIVSSGLNRCIDRARGEVVIRMDVHTEYASDYLKNCLEVLSETGADNVGGPWCAEGTTYLQKAIALAFKSQFSSGGAGSHKVEYEGPVDSVYLGCWQRDVFDRFGLFDEELVRNQDDEHNLRIVRGGGRVWQSPAIKCSYQPRGSLRKLFAQYAQYGYWKVRVIQKHRLPASIRHIVPAAFVAVMGISALLAPLSDVALYVFSGIGAAYMGANILASVVTCARGRAWKYFPVLPAVFATYHFGYGYGFLRGVWDFLVRRRGRGSFARLTRG